MNKLKSTGERINEFDNLENCTVLQFNNLFPECPLDYPEDVEVEIGSYLGADRRELKLGGTETISHKMFRDVLYGVDRDQFYEPDKDEPLDYIMGHPI